MDNQGDTRQGGTSTSTGVDPKVEELAKASQAKDKKITDFQEGRELPKWMVDQGFKSRADFEAALNRRAEEPKPEPKPQFDPSRFEKRDPDTGTLIGIDLAGLREGLLAEAHQIATGVLTEAQRQRAIADERRAVAEAARTGVPKELLGQEGDDAMVESLIDGILAREMSPDQEFATQEQIAQAREKALGFLGRIGGAEAARRAEEARAAAAGEPPAGRPGGGEGSPRQPEPKPDPNETPQQRFARIRDEGRRKFAAENAAT